MTSEARVLSALRRGMRVTRKTAIERGWCENLTATISRLRKKGYVITAIKADVSRRVLYAVQATIQPVSTVKSCLVANTRGNRIWLSQLIHW
jgi:hypothetical protein